MNKCLVRILSFVFCAAMLVGVLPAAQAETLDGRNNPQLMAMRYDENGGIYFTEAAELESLVRQVESFPDVFFRCTYEGSNALQLSNGLTIPENLAVEAYSSTVRIPEGATVTVEGFLGASRLEILGNLNISQSGGIAAAASVQVAGAVQADGFVNLLGGLGTAVTGGEKIACGATGAVWVICAFSNEAELRQQVKAANSAPKGWKYDCYNAVASLNLTEPLVIPRNLYLSADRSEHGSTFTLSGSPITINGEIDIYTTTVIKNDLMLEDDGYLYVQMEQAGDTLTLEGKVVSNGAIDIFKKTVVKKEIFLGDDSWLHVAAPLTLENKVTNLGVIDFYYSGGGVLTISRPDLFVDRSGDDVGVIYINGPDSSIPESVFVGPKISDFTVKHYSSQVADMPCWRLTYYTYRETPPAASADVTPMYRLYNPNSGEHFYTGSIQERDMLVSAGWHYEGIAWNAPTKQGAPVYRLYNPNNGDHHYTMSEEERDMLVGFGWQYEGVAWNSASASNIPMYRLFNPNADCGSHHYTGSTEERDYLVSLGWHFEGIGWYGIP